MDAHKDHVWYQDSRLLAQRLDSHFVIVSRGKD